MKVSIDDLAVRHPGARSGAPDAIRSLSLAVGDGEAVAVIGASGAGKTTLLEAIACALPPSGGKLTVDGRDPWSLSRRELQQLRGHLFLAPQAPPLPPRQRVVTAVLAGRLPAMGLAASLRSLAYPSDIPAAFAALERFDLADKLFDRVDRLSSGERQRVGLARALLSPARLWLVDEPLSALDPVRAQAAIAVLVQAARERGITLVASLHQVDTALANFPRIVGLRDGRKAFDLPARAVSRAMLDDLYAQRDGSRREPDPAEGSAGVAPEAIAVQCR